MAVKAREGGQANQGRLIELVCVVLFCVITPQTFFIPQQGLSLALSCLSFDFVGTCLDDSAEDVSTIQARSAAGAGGVSTACMHACMRHVTHAACLASVLVTAGRSCSLALSSPRKLPPH